MLHEFPAAGAAAPGRTRLAESRMREIMTNQRPAGVAGKSHTVGTCLLLIHTFPPDSPADSGFRFINGKE